MEFPVSPPPRIDSPRSTHVESLAGLPLHTVLIEFPVLLCTRIDLDWPGPRWVSHWSPTLYWVHWIPCILIEFPVFNWIPCIWIEFPEFDETPVASPSTSYCIVWLHAEVPPCILCLLKSLCCYAPELICLNPDLVESLTGIPLHTVLIEFPVFSCIWIDLDWPAHVESLTGLPLHAVCIEFPVFWLNPLYLGGCSVF